MKKYKCILKLFLIFCFSACNKPELKKEIRADGKINIYYELNGVRNGVSKLYYPNGSIFSVISYKDGKRYGTGIVYHKNGKIYAEQNFTNDIQTDSAFYYHENGKINIRQFFIRGKASGLFYVYDTCGKLTEMRNFVPLKDSSKSDQIWNYDTLGNIIPETSFYYQLDFYQVGKIVTDMVDLYKFNDTLLFGDTLGVRVTFHRNYKVKQSLMVVDTLDNDRFEIDFNKHKGFYYGMKDSVSIMHYAKYKLGHNTFRALIYDYGEDNLIRPFYLQKDFVVLPKKK